MVEEAVMAEVTDMEAVMALEEDMVAEDLVALEEFDPVVGAVDDLAAMGRIEVEVMVMVDTDHTMDMEA